MVTSVTGPAPMELVSSPTHPSSSKESVVVVKKNAVTYIVEPDGVTALRYAERSSTLEEMPEAEGSTTLPISRAAVSIWQEFVSDALGKRSWGVDRVQDLCTVAQVAEFLADDGSLRGCVAAVAKHLKTAAHTLVDAWLEQAATGNMVTEEMARTDTDNIVAALSTLHSSLQTAIFSTTDLQLPALAHAVPEELLHPLLDRHLHHGVLDLTLANIAPFSKHLPLDAFVVAVSSLPALEGLTVSSRSLYAEDVPHLASILAAHAGTLKAVSLCNTTDSSLTPYAPYSGESGAELWKALSECTALTSLALGDTILHPKHTTAFCGMLRSFHNLKDLDLSRTCRHNRLKVPSDVLPAVMSVSSLTRLSLADNQLTRPACKHLWSSIGSLHKLRVLDISRNSFKFEDAVMMFAAVATMPAMEELISQAVECSETLSGTSVYRGINPSIFLTPIQSVEGALFFQALSEAGSAVLEWRQNLNSAMSPRPSEHLEDSKASETATDDESQNSITSNLRVLKFRALASTCASTRDLLACMCRHITFNVSGTSFRVESVDPSKVPEGVRSCKPVDALKHVTALDLSHTPMSYEAMPRNTLENFISALPALQDLDLSNCYLPSSALQFVCACLEGRSRDPGSGGGLKILNWSGNQALFDGALRALCSLKSLEKVVLQDCGIAEQRATELGKYIPQLENLVRLDLSRNWLRVHGINALVAGCSQLQALRYLHCGVSVGPDVNLKQTQTQLGNKVTVEMSGDAECNEWVMESWMVADE